LTDAAKKSNTQMSQRTFPPVFSELDAIVCVSLLLDNDGGVFNAVYECWTYALHNVAAFSSRLLD